MVSLAQMEQAMRDEPALLDIGLEFAGAMDAETRSA